MRLFISWSGKRSLRFATILRDWLPNVIQTIDPFLSEEDIKKGNRWSHQLSRELEGCKSGIIAATKRSIKSPWVLFEAGAIAKIIDQSAVIPILLDVTPADLVHHPFAAFQYAKYEKHEMLRVLLAVNGSMVDEGIEEDRLRTAFEKWWPDMVTEVEKEVIFDDEDLSLPLERVGSDVDLSSKIDDLIQVNQEVSRLISNPQRLLPPDYLRRVLQDNINSKRVRLLLRDLEFLIAEARTIVAGDMGGRSARRLDHLLYKGQRLLESPIGDQETPRL